MKKLFAILTATVMVCGLCVAPAFATPYYPTDVTDIDALIPIPYFMDDTAPVTEFDVPDAPGDYEFHIYAEEPNHDGPNVSPAGLKPEPTPVVPTNVVVPDSNEQVDEVTISNTLCPAGQSVLPQTGDRFGDMDSIIAIITAICLAILFMELCRRFEEKED